MSGTVPNATTKEVANMSINSIQNPGISIYDADYDSDYDEFDENCVAIVSNNDNIREAEPVNAKICIGNTETKRLVDSGSVCTIINKWLANSVVSDCPESFWIQSPELHEL